MGARIGIDIGGTFTDFVAVDANTHQIVHTKALSEPSRMADSFSDSLRRLDVRLDDIELLLHGTTLVTNLIIERDGAKVGLITTKGFRDVLEIGWSFRDDAYDLQWTKHIPLVPRPLRQEVRERIGPVGEIRTPLDEGDVRAAAQVLVDGGVQAIVVSFLHSYANRRHEERARELIQKVAPGIPCILSAEVDPRLGEYERVSTAVLNAYAAPRVAGYVEQIERWLPAGTAAYFMQSEGGVAPSSYVKRNPVSLVASGPTAGVLAASHIGQLVDRENLISFDVGGTSCDVCLVREGRLDLKDMVEVQKGVPIRTQSVAVVSVGAGGGSIAWIDEGGALRVGPQSAGAHPGPACYGLGGNLPTVTDANVILGIVEATRFLGGRLKGNADYARRVLSTLASKLGVSLEQAALGVYRIANANMAQAIRKITVQKGIDPRDFTLVAFGGAGGQHAIEVASEMQIRSVLFPPHPSTFSALGLLTADLQITRIRPAVKMLSEIQQSEADSGYSELVGEIKRAFEGIEAESMDRLTLRKFADLRYLGQVHSIQVPVDVWEHARIVKTFEDIHETLYGTRLGDPVQAVNLGLTGVLEFPKPQLTVSSAHQSSGLQVVREAMVVPEGMKIPVLLRASAAQGLEVPTPSLVEEEDSILYLPTGVHARVDQFGNVLCEL